MTQEAVSSERSKFGKICSILVDIFIYPIIILAFVATIMAFSARLNNKVPTLFGTSYVKVETGSMISDVPVLTDQAGYNIDEYLTIHAIEDFSTIKVGEDIAFYAPTWTPFTEKKDNGEIISLPIISLESYSIPNKFNTVGKTSIFIAYLSIS